MLSALNAVLVLVAARLACLVNNCEHWTALGAGDLVAFVSDSLAPLAGAGGGVCAAHLPPAAGDPRNGVHSSGGVCADACQAGGGRQGAGGDALVSAPRAIRFTR
eukprot:COSAG04_NODE_9195_length_888_cov_1.306717_1_plen_104_part_10